MDVYNVTKHVVRSSGLSERMAARSIGKSENYYTQYLYGGRLPSIRVMAELCAVCNFDLLVRNRKTGEETIIDPPEK